MEKENIVYEKAYQFAIRIVNTYKYLTSEKKEFVLSKQLWRCGTSIGANIAEANGAISKAEFFSKISIYSDAEEIAKLLFKILKTWRINKIDNWSLFIDHW